VSGVVNSISNIVTKWAIGNSDCPFFARSVVPPLPRLKLSRAQTRTSESFRSRTSISPARTYRRYTQVAAFIPKDVPTFLFTFEYTSPAEYQKVICVALSKLLPKNETQACTKSPTLLNISAVSPKSSTTLPPS
jgi:hypothetical protein